MKTKNLLLTVVAFMIWFAAYSTESEPNDTKAQANTLALNGSNTGAIGTATDVDWWKVSTTTDGLLSVTLTISNGLNCYVQLFDHDGTTSLTANYSATSVTLSRDGLAPGVYYIKIYPYFSGQMPAYTVSNALTA